MKNMNSILKESVISLNDYFDTNQVDDFFQLVDQVIEQLQLEETHEQVIHLLKSMVMWHRKSAI